MGRVFYTDLPPSLRFCLLALADHANDDGQSIFVGQERLARKLGASVRNVRRHLAELREQGYIERTQTAKGPGRGLSGGSPDHYRIILDKLPGTDEIGSIMETPDIPAGLSEQQTPDTDVLKTGHQRPKDRTPVSSKPSVEPPVQPSALAPLTAKQELDRRGNDLATAYYDIQPLCNFPSVAGICRKAIKAGYTDEAIRAALLRLAEDGRPVTTGTLHVELQGLPERKSRQVDRAAEILKGAMADG